MRVQFGSTVDVTDAQRRAIAHRLSDLERRIRL